MVLFPTPSRQGIREMAYLSSQPSAHHPRLEECAHPVAFPKNCYPMQRESKK